MFEHDDMNFDPTLHEDAQNMQDTEPTPVEQVFSQQPVRPEQPQNMSGSYYSPRSGYPRSNGYQGGYPGGGYPGGGYIPRQAAARRVRPAAITVSRKRATPV